MRIYILSLAILMASSEGVQAAQGGFLNTLDVDWVDIYTQSSQFTANQQIDAAVAGQAVVSNRAAGLSVPQSGMAGSLSNVKVRMNQTRVDASQQVRRRVNGRDTVSNCAGALCF